MADMIGINRRVERTVRVSLVMTLSLGMPLALGGDRMSTMGLLSSARGVPWRGSGTLVVRLLALLIVSSTLREEAPV